MRALERESPRDKIRELQEIKEINSRIDVDFIKTTYDISLDFLHFFVTFRILSIISKQKNWGENPGKVARKRNESGKRENKKGTVTLSLVLLSNSLSLRRKITGG